MFGESGAGAWHILKPTRSCKLARTPPYDPWHKPTIGSYGGVFIQIHVQGYFAHRNMPIPLGPPYDPGHKPTIGSYGGPCTGVLHSYAKKSQKRVTDPYAFVGHFRKLFNVVWIFVHECEMSGVCMPSAVPSAVP